MCFVVSAVTTSPDLGTVWFFVFGLGRSSRAVLESCPFVCPSGAMVWSTINSMFWLSAVDRSASAKITSSTYTIMSFCNWFFIHAVAFLVYAFFALAHGAGTRGEPPSGPVEEGGGNPSRQASGG